MFTLYIVNSRTVRACTAQKTGAFDTQLSQLSNALHSEPPLNDHWYSCPPTAGALATRKGAYANASSGQLKIKLSDTRLERSKLVKNALE